MFIGCLTIFKVSDSSLAYYFVVVQILADMLEELQEHVESIDMANGDFFYHIFCYFLYSFYENSWCVLFITTTFSVLIA